MIGEKNIEILLSNLDPQMSEQIYLFCTLTEEQFSEVSLTPQAFFREEEGVTLVIRAEDENKVSGTCFYPSRMITLRVHSSLEGVGLLAALTKALAAEQISVNAFSGFYHDHLFVKEEEAKSALEILQRFSCPV
ncbi:MAG: ACT domain-containing protein [Bdellovibrionales bacterium]|nr:ACT domain-containing protein [Bdellovibrionales bacterium]